MEIERLQVVLEVESSGINSQIAAVQSQLSSIGIAAGTANKAMSSSFSGLTNIFANMGIGNAMAKSIRAGMQAATNAVKSEMANITNAMTAATTQAAQRNEATMKNIADTMAASMDKVAEKKIEIQVDMTDALEGIEELRTQMSRISFEAGFSEEAPDFDFEVANGPMNVVSSERIENPYRKMSFVDDDVIDMRSGGGSGGGPSSTRGRYDSDDDVPMLTQIRSVMDSVRTEMARMSTRADSSEDKSDDNALNSMNSLLKQINEDTSAIRTRVATGISGSVPGGIASTGKAVMAGAAGGAAGESIFSRIPMMLIAAIAAGGYIIKDSIKSAMDSVESDSMFKTVFGSEATGMRSWSEGAGTGLATMYNTGAQAGTMAPQDLGLDPVAMRDNSAIIYAMTSAMGLASAPAREMSQDLSMLSADMASFYNISSEEAFTKLRAGISGETEGLKALGIVVSDAAVKNYAYSNGLAKQGQELSEAQKAHIRYQLIMQGTSVAQGDLARTINSPANQLRVLRTNLELVKRSLGEAFLPIVTVVLPVLNSFMRGLNTALKYVGAFMRILFGNPQTDATGGTKALAAGYSAAGDAAQAAGEKAEKAKGSLMGFDEINSLSMSSPSGGAGGAGGGISVPEVDNGGLFEQAQAEMDEYEKKVREFLEKAKAWAPILAGVAGTFGLLWTAGHWAKLTEGVGVLVGKFGFLKPLLSPIAGAMKALGAVFSGLGTGPIVLIVAAIASIIAIIVDLWQNSDTFRDNMISLWETVKNAFLTTGAMIWEEGIKPVIASLQNLWEQFSSIYERSRPIFEAVFTFIAQLVGYVVAAIGVITGGLVAVFLRTVAFVVDVIAAFLGCINWIKENWATMWDKVKTFAGDAWTAIKNVFKGADAWMKQKFEGVWAAVKSVFSGVGSFFSEIWDAIKSKFTSIGTKIGEAFGSAFKGVINDILGKLERSINGWIRLLNGAVSIINKIPGINISTIKEMSIPRLARGGIIDSPTIAMVGEAGREAVMPLENNTSWISQLASQIASYGGGSERPVEIILQVGTTELGRVVVESLNKLSRQEGKLALNI